MAERTFLHVGTPKSGTAFLHGVMWRNANDLRDRGFLLPGRMVTHYAAARAITRSGDHAPEGSESTDAVLASPQPDEPHPSHPTHLTPPAAPTGSSLGEAPTDETPWAKLTRQVNSWGGRALIGHPQLASATAPQIATALEAIDGEVALVVTARALHLQPALSWQDQVKGGLAATFDSFLAGLRDDRARGRRFWRVHDVADLVTRWRERRVPVRRVHLIPVSPLTSPAGPRLADLWRRYAETFGLDPSAYDADVPVQLAPLGPAELELLRRVHARRDPRFTDPQRHVWTRQLLANGILARRPAAPLRLPDETLDWLGERSTAILAALEQAGYSVHGDLADLHHPEPETGARLVGDITDDEIDETSAWTILRLQEELVHREPVAQPPPVGPDDGIDGILELLEHIRAADTGADPRAAPERDASRVARIRRALPVRRPR